MLTYDTLLTRAHVPPSLGWVPDDPRSALGICQSLGFLRNLPWDGNYQPWQTGGSGAGTIAATALASFSQYPPPALSNVAGANPAQLPMYTATAAPVTLPPPQLTAATVSVGNGDRKSTRLNSSHSGESRMPSSA